MCEDACPPSVLDPMRQVCKGSAHRNQNFLTSVPKHSDEFVLSELIDGLCSTFPRSLPFAHIASPPFFSLAYNKAIRPFLRYVGFKVAITSLKLALKVVPTRGHNGEMAG